MSDLERLYPRSAPMAWDQGGVFKIILFSEVVKCGLWTAEDSFS